MSWHNADDEVKLFCAEVSDILMQEYKKALYQQKQQNDNINIEEEEDSLMQFKRAKKKEAIRPSTMSSQVASSTTEKEVSSTTSAMINRDPGAQPGTTQQQGDKLFNKDDFKDGVGDSQMSSDEDYGPHKQKTSVCNYHRVPGEASLKDDDAELDSSVPNV